jgi:hypothetical protein
MIVVASLFPVGAFAQQTGAIAGVVKDSSGAVLPGVTVEASSPALIEKVRVVTTDGAGLYRIVDLPPGVYIMTYSLAGFSTVKRDGIELTVGFTANVSADLPVGDLAETLTVSGASPLVDVQNVLQQRVITRVVLDTIPTSRQYTSFAVLIPGLTPSAPGGAGGSVDVGGSGGMNFINMQVHGGRDSDTTIRINSMSVSSITSPGNSRTNIQDGNVEEYQMQLAAQPAEFPYGGVYINVIPKSGGNEYHGALFAGGTTGAFQSDNLGELKARGLGFASEIKRIIDINPSFGGPLAKNQLWFYAAGRQFVTDVYPAGLYTNKDVRAWVYQPSSERAVSDQHGKNGSLNLTFQATPKNRFKFFYNYDFQCYCKLEISSVLSAEASRRTNSRNHLYQGMWSSPVTNRFLVEASASRYIQELPRDRRPDALEPSILEQSTNIRFRSNTSYVRNNGIMDHYRAAASYVTAAHVLKVGMEVEHQWADDSEQIIGNVSYRTLNGIPNQVTYYTLPYAWNSTMMPWAIYAQDQWRLRRWTVNAGVRYDRFTGSYPASHVPPTQFLPVARDYPGADVLSWKDLNPRLGVSWDVFGTGKTAVKATVSRFIQQEGKTQTNATHPVIAATNTLARRWNDTNGDFIVQGDPLNPAPNEELGPSPDVNFGKPITTLHFDPAWSNGYGTRPFDWETSAGVNHEIMPGVSMTAMYFRRVYGNFVVTQNVLVNPADYDPYCITAPSDPRLPGGGGQRICGLYDLNPSKVGLVDLLRANSGKFGSQYRHWNGVDLTMNARLRNGLLLQGGVSTGKSMTDDCQVAAKIGRPSAIGNPSTYNCHQETPFLTQTKFLGSFPLPWWGVQLSGAFQRAVYEPTGTTFASNQDVTTGMRALYVATNAVIAPSLGRALSGGAANATIDLLKPGIYFDPFTQIDFRAAKTFTVGSTQIQGLFDIYNLFNDNTPLNFQTAYGTSGVGWAQPTAALPGRVLRFGVQVNF